MRIREVLSRSDIARVRRRESFVLAWLVDICANHSDARQAVFCERDNRTIDAVFVDHGHMFGGPSGRAASRALASRHLDARVYDGLSSDYLSSLRKIAQALNTDSLWRQYLELPEEWKTESALAAFFASVQCLSDSKQLEAILQAISDSIRWSYSCDQIQPSRCDRSQLPVLHSGIPAMGEDFRRGAERACNYSWALR